MADTNDLNPSAPPYLPPFPGKLAMHHYQVQQPLKPRAFLPHQIFAYSRAVSASSVPQYVPASPHYLQYMYYHPHHCNVAYYMAPAFFPSPENFDNTHTADAVVDPNSPVQKPAYEKESGKTVEEKITRQQDNNNMRRCSAGSRMRWEKQKGPMVHKVYPPRLVTKQVISSSAADLRGKTTLMIKNIPNMFIRKKLINILDQFCRNQNRMEKRKGGADLAYDFLYLPMDFKSGSNLGYAFVNFTTSQGASKLRKFMNNHGWVGTNSKKTCQISLARIQGKNDLQRHFQNVFFPCNSDDYLPVVFLPPRDGSLRNIYTTTVGRHLVTSHN